MRRVRHDHGSLYIESAALPQPGPGELLVRAEAIGVTLPVVRKVAAGEPVELGGEVAGEVVAVGDAVTGFAVGERVTGLCFKDGYAEFTVLTEAMASRIPDGASAVDAVALVRSGLVARGAYEAARHLAGESVLVTAAASATGHIALQLAHLGGASRVVAAVGSADKAEFVRGFGADEVVTYGQEGWGEPVDVVLDAVGGALLSPAIAALAPKGRLVAFSSGGGTIQAYDLLVGAKTVIGFQMAMIAREQPALYAAWREELWELHGAGKIRTAVAVELPLTDAAKAHELIVSRANLGKVVLVTS
ncbi:quinone oxidoreductase family protein [Streptomyces sp. NBC_01465]|uniref:quinone oxidoreductase family protein n=1 Tax=Streptomyces sp. NBC_01465 TaxID=2903878 RepID=UPI002E344D9C|nr:zinc-binding dehydrogenase [Streptomyces sp. NBC_01465]